jgi:hypothetical protein
MGGERREEGGLNRLEHQELVKDRQRAQRLDRTHHRLPVLTKLLVRLSLLSARPHRNVNQGMRSTAWKDMQGDSKGQRERDDCGRAECALHLSHESSLACTFALSSSVMHATAAFFVVAAFCCCCWSCCQRSWRVLTILLLASPDACPRHTTIDFSVRTEKTTRIPQFASGPAMVFLHASLVLWEDGAACVCWLFCACVSSMRVCLFDLIFLAFSPKSPSHKPASCRWVEPSHGFLVICTMVQAQSWSSRQWCGSTRHVSSLTLRPYLRISSLRLSRSIPW